MKVHNVWIIVESYDENNIADKAKDTVIGKVAKFKTNKQAIDFATELLENNNTPRDKNGYTI